MEIRISLVKQLQGQIFVEESKKKDELLKANM